MPKGKFKNPKERSSKISEQLKKGKYFNCLSCGVSFWRRPFDIKNGNNKFCSKNCYFEWQKGKSKGKYNRDQSKEKNPNWKGGVSDKNNLIRTSKKYKNWRKKIFKRDDWTCQKCGSRSGKNKAVILHAHHIKPFALYPDLRFNLENGITLCKKCHNKEPKGREIYV